MKDDFFRFDPEEPDEEETVDAADFETEPEEEAFEPALNEPVFEPETEEAQEFEADDSARAISSDLIRGHINTIILRSLYDGDKYGYEIIAEIERKSRKQYSLKQPSLYSALKRLEKDGYITSYWGGSAGGGRRKYFSLTDEGKAIAERNQTEWEYSRTVIDSLISDKDYDFSQPAPAAVDMRMLKRSTSRVPRAEEDGEFEYEESYETETEDALAAQRAAFEEERARYEERLREREEYLRVREEAGVRREQELLEREFALQAEAERREQIAAEEAETARLQAEAEEAERQARLEEEARRIAEAEEQARLRAEAEELAKYQEEQAIIRAQAEAQARLEAEQAKLRAEKERAQLEAQIEEVERARAMALRSGKSEQNNRIVEMEPFTEERARYEQMLRDQEAELNAMHRRELAEQEERIRAEEAHNFRQREQQMIHQNYLSLVNGFREEEDAPKNNYSYYYGGEQPQTKDAESYVFVSKPENEREYRSIIQKLYATAIKQEPAETPVPAPVQPAPAPAPVPVQPVPQPAPAPQYTRAPEPMPVQPAPAPAPAPKAERHAERPVERPAPQRAARSLDGVDFYDLELRAAQDGIRITTSGGGTRKEINKPKSDSLVHKGRALFFSALVVFLLCIAEGSVALGLQNRLSLPIFYPYFIWGTGLALLLVTGLAYLNHYGERALRQTGNLLVNIIVSYALCVIVILIVALARSIDFADMGELASYIIFPVVYFFSVVVFGVVYFMQIRPNRED